MPRSLICGLLWLFLPGQTLPGTNVAMPPKSTPEGFLSRLLINEVAFPGERGFVSEDDSKRAMENILLVLDARIYFVPPRYLRSHIAQTNSDKLVDIITAGGYHGQVEGFYLDETGKPAVAPRVEERLDYLLRIAEDGKPGRFARLMNHAVTLSETYAAELDRPMNLFLRLRLIRGIPVTGRAYSWMTDFHNFHPGGNFVRIPNQNRGSLSGNRFFSLRDLEK